MHDIRKIRQDPTGFDTALMRRGEQACSKYILSIDRERRKKILETEQALERRNIATRDIKLAKEIDELTTEQVFIK